MEGQSQFERVSLSNERNFSWVFLVDWVLLCVVTLTVIFYLGRLFAYAITLVLEWFLWKHWKVKISVESLRIAPLSGSILFRNLCIIGKDQTISILKGSLRWRYRLLATRRSQYEEASSQKDGLGVGEEDVNSMKNITLPCRFVLFCEGFEIFIYNRTVAYENIIQMFSREERVQFEKFMSKQEMSELFHCHSERSDDKGSTDSVLSSSVSDVPNINDRVFDEVHNQKKSIFMRFLPMELQLSRGSIVLGNKFTPSLLIASCTSGRGVVDLCQPKEKLDLYKMHFQVDFIDIDISIRQNIEYNRKKATFKNGKLSRMWATFVKVLHIPFYNKSHNNKGTESEPFMTKWKGLGLYKGLTFDRDGEDYDEVHFDFANHEYAKVSNIIKSPRTVLTYSYDIPGVVPHGAHPTLEGPEVGNNGAPPEFGIDLQFYGVTICYGPWAQREIQHLLRMISPTVARSSVPIKTLSPGSRRIYTVFKTTFRVLDGSSWRIPTRERSKDQEFLKKFKATSEEYRPFGWLDLKFAMDSYGSVTTVLCPKEEGFPNKMYIHFAEMEATSSVNHDVMLKCNCFDVAGDVGYPLGWNSSATWTINLHSTQLETFLLREHVTLVADIFTDFSSGEPTPYELFRPFIYQINWIIDGYSIYLNVNDHNIVNNPLDFNENCYLSLHGEELLIDVTAPNDSITGAYMDVPYEISTPMFRLLLNTPPWNTLNEFMKNKEVGRSYSFAVCGLYTVYSELDIDNVDTLSVECTSTGTTLHCYGFVMRYLMNVKMNYFGDFFHFITSEEYTGVIRAKEKESVGKTEEESLRDNSTNLSTDSGGLSDPYVRLRADPPVSRSDVKRTTNETDIWFTFSVWEGALVLPETIYNCDPCVALHFGELIVDLRSCNYYMDLLATMSSTSIKRYVSRQSHELFESIRRDNGRTEKEHGSLAALTIHGHRMYGLPPIEPTYFCQWGIDLDGLTINSDAEFAKGFFTLFAGIGFGYTNLENTLLYDVETPDDMTSVTVRVRDMNVVVENDSSRAVVDVPNLTFTSIDFENERYSQRIDLKVPSLSILLLTSEDDSEPIRLMDLTTKVYLTDFIQKRDFAKHRSKQRDYITLNDSPFYRCSFLLPCYLQESPLYKSLLGSISPSSSLPPLPMPLLAETIDFIIEDLLGEFAAGLKCDYDTQRTVDDPDSPSESFDTSQEHEGPDDVRYDRFAQLPKILSPNPLEQYDNVIIDVKFLAVDLDPLICSYVDGLLGEFWKVNTVDIIDEIEMSIVKRLGQLWNNTCVLNLKLYVVDINFFWGDKNAKGVDLYFDKLDFDLGQRTRDLDGETIVSEKITLSKLRSVRATVFDRSITEGVEERPPALSLAVEGWEAYSWMREKIVGSVSLLSTDITVDESQLEWLSVYIAEQRDLIKNMLTSFTKLHEYWQGTRRDLLRDITTASEHYQISHEPYVITKPAFIMRLSNGHVRENPSWRIITRLRHILTYLPNEWRNNSAIQVSPTVDSTDASVASHWRRWEISDITRSYIYRTIFLSDQSKTQCQSLKKMLKVDFHSFFFTIYSEGYRVAHNFVITRANIVGEEIPAAELSKVQQALDYDNVMNLTVSLGAIKGELNDQLLKLRNIFSKAQTPALKRSKTSINISKSYKVNVLLAFDRSELQFVLGQTRLTNRILNGKATLLLEKLKDSAAPALSFVFFAKRSESWLKHADLVLAEALSRELSSTMTAELWSYMPSLSINIQCSNSHIRAMTSTELLVNSIKQIMESISELKRHFAMEKITPNVQGTSTNLSIPLQNTALTVSFSDVTAELMPLTPFVVRHEMKQLGLYLNRVQSNEILISIWDANIILKSHQTTEQYFNFALGDLQVKCNLPTESSAILNVGLSTSLMKLTLSEPRRILSSFLQDEKLIGESLGYIKGLLQLFSPLARNKTQSSALRWSLDANLNYFGILVPMASTFFVFEIHMLLAAMNNASDGQDEGDHHVTGQVSIENCLLLIKEPSLPADLSKLLDFSIRVMSSQKVPNSPQSYQIESSHFRVCLSPGSLVQVLWGTHQLQSLLEYFRKHRKQDKAISPFSLFDGSASADRQIDFRSIHILSYNLCIGWMFQLGDDVKTGLIIGFDRLFSAYEKHYGKLTLIDGYFSVANGQSTDTFYSQGSEKQRYNRSFLSNVQITYWLKEIDSMKDLFIRVNGEALEVSLLSNSFDIIESTLASIQKFQTLKKERMHKRDSGPRNKLNLENTSNNISPFLSHIRTIDCQFKYVGGVLKIYSLDDLNRAEGPSLEIKSPGVVIALKYNHNEAERRPHRIRCLVSIDPTHNILYSQCVPILNDIVEASQRMVQKHSPDETPLESSQSIDYKSLLDSFDIAFKVTSGRQQLSLSCEPRAKVQADVGFDSFTFGVTTNDLVDGNPTGVSLSVEKIQSSVRHIFSRETSASFSVDFVDFTSIFTHPDVFGVALVSDINVFFNMKQLQNLNLFLDIWQLNGKLNNKGRAKDDDRKKQTKSMTLSKRTSTPTSICWSFTLIFTNVKGDVDLGPSLGVLSLRLSRTWFATDHYGAQRRVLHAFADELSIKSEGRLSGVFDLKNATWISEVNYPAAGSIKGSPEMSLSLSVGRVAIKTAFDYHMFLIGTIDEMKFHLRSESDLYGILPDLLVVALSCKEMDFCATALTAANILDIYNTITRMRQDNRISYIETLRESNSTEARVTLLYDDILQSLNLLRTDLSFDITTFKAQISPISLFDVEVLVLNIDNVSARSETQSGEKLKTELHLQVSNAKVSLSTSKEELDEERVAKISIEDYMLYASKVSGGTIVKVPRLLVSMTTWQKPKSDLIEYLFTCRFFDRVAVKWNLGPINFIKEMWSTHIKSLAVRQTQSNKTMSEKDKQADLDPEEEIKAKLQYVPLDEPYIEMPQIKDLGDATPPMEWFGVHRKRLPAATHQLAIVLIQKLVHAAEKEYAKVQGRSQ